jgi:hypothetical protein
MTNKKHKPNNYNLPTSLSREGFNKPDKEPFISFPRYLTEHLRNRLITYRELELYVWIRLHANMFGIAIINTYAIGDDLPHFKSSDYITKILRSLREKKYIFYYDRQGHRGSFEVHFGDWLLKGGKVKQLDKFFGMKKVRSEHAPNKTNESEVVPSSNDETPKSNNQEIPLNTDNFSNDENSIVRSGKNDKETENTEHTERVVDDSLPKKKTIKKTLIREKIRTSEFEPLNPAEAKCQEIALAVNDDYINFILSKLYHKYGGVDAIIEAYDNFEEIERIGDEKNDPIENHAAMFNYCLRQVIGGREIDKLENNEHYG